MKPSLTFYGVYWQLREARLYLELYKKDKLSPDLVHIKELEIINLEYVLSDLKKQMFG